MGLKVSIEEIDSKKFKTTLVDSLQDAKALI
jgi:hypothetical protein